MIAEVRGAILKTWPLFRLRFVQSATATAQNAKTQTALRTGTFPQRFTSAFAQFLSLCLLVLLFVCEQEPCVCGETNCTAQRFAFFFCFTVALSTCVVYTLVDKTKKKNSTNTHTQTPARNTCARLCWPVSLARWRATSGSKRFIQYFLFVLSFARLMH